MKLSKVYILVYMPFLAIFFSCSNSEEPISNDANQNKTEMKNMKRLSRSVSNVGTYTTYVIESKDRSNTVQVQIDVAVESLGDLKGNLFFPAMQVNFGPDNQGELDGAHLGLQQVNNNKVTNWGGYFREFKDANYRYTPFFNNGPNVTDENSISSPVLYNPEPGVNVYVGHYDPGTYTQANEKNSNYFNWKTQTWYRYKVYRDGEEKGYYKWRGVVEDLESGTKYDIGTVYSKASYIDSFVMWVETSFSDNTLFDVRFIYPKYKLSNGNFIVPNPKLTTPGISNNPNCSVVVPDKDRWDAAQTVWHRNGIEVPANAYKSKTMSTTNW